ncbi:rRNA-processing protein fyv7 [Aplysia californica]|uniref:rRNA-processing protein fyv7 n=1 Tax=Aplysia californica TaxID=6500 RepID=A0ABM0JX21_APLCA|nr:rRNA-processing protein fyv7 [Aplysia californica]
MNRAKKKGEDFKTFFGNKKEGQGFADKRKKKAAYEYLKLLKKEKQQKIREGKEPEKHRPLAFLSPHGKDKGKKSHAFSAAQKVAQKKQEERRKKQEEGQQVQQEKETALKAYKDRKREQHLKLCKKTSKGQPVMRHQMEVLLEKIKKQKGGGS